MHFREDQALIHVAVDGVGLDNQPWQSMDGGELTAPSNPTRPGGMAPAIELGSPSARNNVTVTRLYTEQLHALLLALEARNGKGAMRVSYTLLDADANATGDTITIPGILLEVHRPKGDANSNTAGVLTLVMGAHEQASSSAN